MSKTPIRAYSKARLSAAIRLWERRRRARARQLAKVRKIRTARRPRTKVTPMQKRRLIVKWERQVASADRVLKRLRAEKHRRSLTLGQRALLEARKLVGVMEQGGNNRGADVMEIIRGNQGVGPEPWCGDFVAVCYKRAGSTVVQRAWAAVRYLGFLTGMKRVGVRAGREGDILCFTFDHTGLLVGYCDADGNKRSAGSATHVRTIEGNTGATGAVSDSKTGGDGVYVKIRKISDIARCVRVTR